MTAARDHFLLAGLAVLIAAIAAVIGLQATHSAPYNFIWTAQFAEAIGRGEFYPRWLPRSFEGLGSPTFFFYPPLAFYVSGLLDLVGLSTVRAVEAAAAMFALASGASMYAWLCHRGGRPLLGATLYMLAPYHLLDLFVRGALSEHAAFIWLPLIALGIERHPRAGRVLLPLAYAGLIMTHLPIALLTTIFLIVPLLLRHGLADRARLWAIAASLAIGIGLAGVYLLPALTLQAHISTGLLWSPYYDPTSWLLLGGTGRIPFNAFAGGLVACGSAAAVVALLSISRAADARWWGLLALGALAATAGVIPLIWEAPLLAKVQFPWRLLCIVEFAAITAVALVPAVRLRTATVVAVVLPALALVATLAVSTARRPHPVMDHPAVLVGMMPDAPEYLPRGLPALGVTDLQRIPDLSAYRHLSRGSIVRIDRRGPVVLGRAAFPMWRVSRDGVGVATRGPLLSFDAQPGDYRVERVVLWQEWAGWSVTILAVLAMLSWNAASRTGRVRPGPFVASQRPC